MTGGRDVELAEEMWKAVELLVKAGVVEDMGERKLRLTDEFFEKVEAYTGKLRLRDAVKEALVDFLGDVSDRQLRNPYLVVSSIIVLVVREARGMLAAKIVEEELLSAPFLAENP